MQVAAVSSQSTYEMTERLTAATCIVVIYCCAVSVSTALSSLFDSLASIPSGQKLSWQNRSKCQGIFYQWISSQ